MLLPHQYFAYKLAKRRSSNSLETLAGAVAGARVESPGRLLGGEQLVYRICGKETRRGDNL